MNDALCLELAGADATEQFGAALARIFTDTRCFSHVQRTYSGMQSATPSKTFPNVSLDIFVDTPSDSDNAPISDTGITANLSNLTNLGILSGLYLIGDLGTGKTTFARGFVQAMPCGDKADIASPSFALCNMYDTKPPVLHCDVYRTSGALTEDLELALDDGYPFVLVEWADLIPKMMLPPHRLEITFTGEGEKRFVQLQPFGDVACYICTHYAFLMQNGIENELRTK